MKTLLPFLLLLIAANVFAQSSSHFEISRNVVADGGATLVTSSHFQLAGTVAQPLAAVPASSHFSIQGGFWIWPAPILFGPTTTGTNFLVRIQSELGKTYTLQYQNAIGTGWQNLTSVTGNGNVITITNSSTNASRFIRLEEQ